MGVVKRKHIKQLLNITRINQTWYGLYTGHAADKDIDKLNTTFTSLQKLAISECNTLTLG